MPQPTELFTTIITIIVPLVAIVWKFGEFFITRQKLQSAERIRKIEKDGEVKIEEMKINANLKTQAQITEAVNESSKKINALNNKFNSLIDFLVEDPSLREKLRKGDD